MRLDASCYIERIYICRSNSIKQWLLNTQDVTRQLESYSGSSFIQIKPSYSSRLHAPNLDALLNGQTIHEFDNLMCQLASCQSDLDLAMLDIPDGCPNHI